MTKLQERIEAAAQKEFGPCEGPQSCNSWGVCSYCMDMMCFKAGAEFVMKDAEVLVEALQFILKDLDQIGITPTEICYMEKCRAALKSWQDGNKCV